ncbi:MAG: MobF family relaxase [Motilibacteraceae bacterium]
MLSIGRLAGPKWAAEYYLAQQAGCPEDYYLGASERQDVWLGSGSAALGLAGAVDADAFRRLLRGIDPWTGEQLAKPVWRVDPRAFVPAAPVLAAVRELGLTTDQIETRLGSDLLAALRRAAVQDKRARSSTRAPEASLRAYLACSILRGLDLDPDVVLGPRALAEAALHLDDRVDVRLPGMDLTFSAPKSVSLLFALCPPQVAEQVRLGHEAAVTAGVAYLEDVAAYGLRGHQGDGREAARVSTEGFIAAAFQHRSNRCGDPQLHDHVVVANLLRGADGRVSALPTRELYEHARTAGFLYQAALRHELTTRLGVAWTPVRRGHAEVAGVPVPLRRMFSKRRQQVEAELERTGRADARSAQDATLLTRPGKDSCDQSLRQRWADEARQAGYDRARLSDVLGVAQPPALDEAAFVDVAGTVLADTGLTGQTASFDGRDLLRAVASALPAGAPVPTVRQWSERLLHSDDVVPLLLGGRDRQAYSTARHLAAEQRALALAAALAAVPRPAVAGEVPAGTLTDEQRDVVQALVGRPRGVDVVVGKAGAGKTSALRVAYEQWREWGEVVLGTAVAANAAQQLQQGSGIPSQSLTRLLADADRRDDGGVPLGLPRGCTVVVDEAGMVGTLTLLRLLEHAAAADARLVLVGDPRQLPPVEAGGLFQALVDRHQPLVLDTNLRQSQDWEKVALDQLRAGDVAGAVAEYVLRDRVTSRDSRGELWEQLVQDWAQRRTDGKQVLMVASRTREAAGLNRAAHEHLRVAGVLSGEELTVGGPLGERSFAVGDEVLVTRNSYDLGLLNGTRAQVAQVRPDGLELALPDGRDVRLSRFVVADRIAHGYAVTCHKAQGMTADASLVYATDALSREAAYVAMSRGRTENRLYVVDADLDTLLTGYRDPEVDDLPADRESPHPLPPRTTAFLTETMSRSDAKTMATRYPRRLAADRGDERAM